jgi:formylmethanofuran dehydrogenase subunit D
MEFSFFSFRGLTYYAEMNSGDKIKVATEYCGVVVRTHDSYKRDPASKFGSCFPQSSKANGGMRSNRSLAQHSCLKVS